MTVTDPGAWSLADLNYGDTPVLPVKPVERVAFSYDLLDGAKQGPVDWWQIDLDFDITFSSTAHGSVYVSAATNGFTAASVVFDLSQWASRGLITWNTVDEVNGQLDFESTEPSIHVDYRNYLRRDGVRGGRNELTVRLEQIPIGAVESLTVLDQTGVRWTDNSPDDVELKVEVPTDAVYVGDTFSVDYTVTNVDPEPAFDLVLAVEPMLGSGLELRSPASSDVPLGDVIVEASGTLQFEATAPGTFEVPLAVSGRFDNDADFLVVQATVTPGSPPGSGQSRLFAASALVMLAIGSVLMLVRRRA